MSDEQLDTMVDLANRIKLPGAYDFSADGEARLRADVDAMIKGERGSNTLVQRETGSFMLNESKQGILQAVRSFATSAINSIKKSQSCD